MCCRAKDAAGTVPFDAEPAPNWRRKEPEDKRRVEESEWGHASIDGSMPGHEIGPHGDDPGAKGSRNLYLWTGSHVRVSRSSGGSLSTLSDPREPHKHTRWNDT